MQRGAFQVVNLVNFDVGQSSSRGDEDVTRCMVTCS